jgi:hypothetical protein
MDSAASRRIVGNPYLIALRQSCLSSYNCNEQPMPEGPLVAVELDRILNYRRDTGAQAGVASSYWLSVKGRCPEPSAFIRKSSP